MNINFYRYFSHSKPVIEQYQCLSALTCAPISAPINHFLQ